MSQGTNPSRSTAAAPPLVVRDAAQLHDHTDVGPQVLSEPQEGRRHPHPRPLLLVARIGIGLVRQGPHQPARERLVVERPSRPGAERLPLQRLVQSLPARPRARLEPADVDPIAPRRDDPDRAVVVLFGSPPRGSKPPLITRRPSGIRSGALARVTQVASSTSCSSSSTSNPTRSPSYPRSPRRNALSSASVPCGSSNAGRRVRPRSAWDHTAQPLASLLTLMSSRMPTSSPKRMAGAPCDPGPHVFPGSPRARSGAGPSSGSAGPFRPGARAPRPATGRRGGRAPPAGSGARWRGAGPVRPSA